MKENLRRLRQSRCLPYLATALSFLAAWTGETGSLVWGGLCNLLSLPLLAAPEYLLAPLYNAPVTMDSYYTFLVNHDLYGSGDRSLQIKSQAPIERKVQSGLE